MTEINGATIYSDTFGVMYNTVSGILAGSLNGIYSFFPDVGKADFPGYPICTIEGANVAKSRETLGSNYQTLNGVNVMVMLHSKSMQSLDQLSDKLVSGVQASNKGYSGTYVSGLRNFELTSSDVAHNNYGTDRVHTRAFGLNYEVWS